MVYNIQKNIRISEKMLKSFEEICAAKGLSMSEVLRALIAEYIEKNSK